MRLALSEDQSDFREVVQKYLTGRLTSDHTRRFVEDEDSGYDLGLWQSMAAELGLPGLVIEEELGGSGAGLVELALVFEEAGRAMLCSPLFATTALAVPLLLAAPTGADRDELLGSIASGGTTATAVLPGRGEKTPLTASLGDQPRVSGTTGLVVDGATADVLLLVADTDEGPALFSVDRESEGLDCTALATLDPTRPLASVVLRSVPAKKLASGESVVAALGQARAVASILLAAEQLGGLQASLDMAVAHAGSRVQFERPIGAFQAVKHRCADMFVDLELSRWSVYVAACRMATPADEALFDDDYLAAMTRVIVSEAFQRSAASLLQVLGGIGYTWEHDAHFLFKRSASSARLLGTVDEMLEMVADGIGMDA